MITGTILVFLLGAFLLGMVIAFVLVTPARIAMDRSTREHNREEKSIEHELRELQHQHAQLEAEHTGLVAERDHLRQQLAATTRGTDAPSPSNRTASADGRMATADGRSAAFTPERDRIVERTETTSTEEQPTIGERLRGMFHSPRDETSADAAWKSEEQPPEPTA